MKTIAIGQAQSGVEVEKREKSLVQSVWSVFAWVWDRFDFWVIHRGRRLRPEAQEELLESLEEARQGKGLSPAFTNTEDAIKWLRRDV